MKKLFLILTTFIGLNAFSVETEIQPNVFKCTYNYTMPKVKSSAGLLVSGYLGSVSTIVTAYFALSTKYYAQEAFRFAKDFSPACHPFDHHTATGFFGVTMLNGLSTLTMGALTMWCLYYFGKNYKDLFYGNNPIILKNEPQTK